MCCYHSLIIFRQHISICRPPSMMTKWSFPYVFSHHHSTCFAGEQRGWSLVTIGISAALNFFAANWMILKVWCIVTMDLFHMLITSRYVGILCSTVMHCSALYMHNSSDRVPVVITNFIIRSVLNGIYTSSIHLILVAFASSMWCQTWK